MDFGNKIQEFAEIYETDGTNDVKPGDFNEIEAANWAKKMRNYLKKKAKVFQALPHNFYGLDGTCSVHACHRIIQKPEKRALGTEWKFVDPMG